MPYKVWMMLVFGIVVGLLLFAAWRISPYLGSRVDGVPPQSAAVTRTIRNQATPEYDRETLKTQAAELGPRLRTTTVAALKRSSPHSLPPQAVESISRQFSEYMAICRGGSCEDYQVWCSTNRREPTLPATLNDPGLYWDLRTLWARHGPIDPESVQVDMLAWRGVPVQGAQPPRANGPIRENPGGGYVSVGKHDHHVLYVSVAVTIPNADLSEDVEGRAGVVFVNGPGQEWTPVQVGLRGVPDAFVVSLPPT